MNEKIIPIVSTKGGTGKTTGAVNLGAALAEQGKRVCVVDLDPQCSATVSLGFEKGLERTIGDIFTDSPLPVTDLVRQTQYGVDLVPASPGLMTAEDWIQQTVFGEARLQRSLAEPAFLDQYDVVLVDTPGYSGRLLISALVAADAVVITLKPSALSNDVLDGLIESIRTVGDQRGRPLPVLATYFNEVRGNTNIARVNIADAQTIEAANVIELFVSVSKDVEEAIYARMPVIHYKPKSAPAGEYRSLAHAIFGG